MFETVGGRSLALEHAVVANDLLVDGEEWLMRPAAPLCLADSLATSGSHIKTRGRYSEALVLVAGNNWCGFIFGTGELSDVERRFSGSRSP